MSIIKLFKKLVILSHRYIGIPLSFVFVMWFASAFVMIYAGGMPRITPQMRIEAAPKLDFSTIEISPSQLETLAGYSPASVKLKTILGRPAYEIHDPGFGSEYVYADTGEFINEFDQAQSLIAAANYLNISPQTLTFSKTINEVDQWTLTSRRELPLHKFTVDDELATEVYVSARNRNVTVYTTRQSRLLAWLGTIPHWFYFTSLRLNQPLWYGLVVWSAGIGCVLALLGLVLGVTQLRQPKPFKLSAAIPYKRGMRWHYIFGSLFGILTLTWAFSGLLSMEPFAWTNVQGLAIDGNVYTQGNLRMREFPEFKEEAWSSVVHGDIKEIELLWIQGEPYFLALYNEKEESDRVKRERLHQPYYVIGQAEANSVLLNTTDLLPQANFDTDSLVAQLDASLVEVSVTEYELLSDYDDYYYSRNNQIPLPVIRVKFDDPQSSWVYIDPKQSQIITLIHRWSRVERWLYNGLHSLDFAFWYHKRPLWDAVVIILLLGGLISSGTGLYFGLRRLKNDCKAVWSRLFVSALKEINT